MRGTTARQSGARNRILRTLTNASYERLSPALVPVALSRDEPLFSANERIEHFYFPESCVASVATVMPGGDAVEVATVGKEGVVGVPLILGADSTTSSAVTQIPGDAQRVDAAALGQLARADAGLNALLLRYAQAFVEQVSQSVVCGRRHTVKQRCARWLLETYARVRFDELPVTQDFLSNVLGVRRASVTVAIGVLERAKIIRCARGRVTILDHERLAAASCECVRMVTSSYDRLLGRR